MIVVDTHIVIGIDDRSVTVQCPFNNVGPWQVPVEENHIANMLHMY